MERELRDPPGVLVLPDEGPVTSAVLVLSGSSGRLEVDRARLLAARGAAAATVRWFGGPRQPPGICLVSLETFAPALALLAEEHEHLAVLGTSKGAEAALLLAAGDERLRAVAAFAPTSVVWANVGPGPDGLDRPLRSSWTRYGLPLPFVPYASTWSPGRDEVDADGAVAHRSLYETSLRTDPARVATATVPVERIAGEVLLAAGGDDRVWPSTLFAERVAARRAAHGLATTVVTHPGAGHRVRLPGEPLQPASGGGLVRGGDPAADAALGAAVWEHLRRLLRLR